MEAFVMWSGSDAGQNKRIRWNATLQRWQRGESDAMTLVGVCRTPPMAQTIAVATWVWAKTTLSLMQAVPQARVNLKMRWEATKEAPRSHFPKVHFIFHQIGRTRAILFEFLPGFFPGFFHGFFHGFFEDFSRIFPRFFQDFSRIFRGFLDYFWIIFGVFLEYFWRSFGGVLEDFWRIFGVIWNIFERFLDDFGTIFGGDLEEFWRIFGDFTGRYKRYSIMCGNLGVLVRIFQDSIIISVELYGIFWILWILWIFSRFADGFCTVLWHFFGGFWRILNDVWWLLRFH